MEMWELGVVLPPLRLAGLVLLSLPVLVVLVRYLGFRDGKGLGLADHVADALVAFGIGVATSLAAMLVVGVLDGGRTVRELAGLVAIQSVPASMGAAIARSHFVAGTGGDQRQLGGYRYELLLMAVGCALLAFSVAPTAEVVLLAGRVGALQGALVAVASMAGLHAIVYSLGFRGQHRSDAPFWSVFLGYTVVGYVITLAVCLALLWTFGQTDGAGVRLVLVEAVVLAVPGSFGAGAARLVL
nr:TIGR02587 family membrane protein [Salsipaludibacter albus]